MGILETFYSAPMLHAAAVHAPIMLSVFGLPLIALTFFLPKRLFLRVGTVAAYALLAITAWLAEQTGNGAEAHISPDAPRQIWEALHLHTEMASRVAPLAALTTIILLFSFIPQETLRAVMMLFAACAALSIAVVTALAAHYGGELVYEHGVGTALFKVAPPTEAAPAPAADLVPIRDIDPAAAQAVSYTRDIKPILEDRCLDCHENPDADGAWDCTTVENMKLAGEKEIPGIIPGKPDESAMVLYIRGIKQPRMPKKKPALSADDLHLIRQWIAAGAVDDSAS